MALKMVASDSQLPLKKRKSSFILTESAALLASQLHHLVQLQQTNQLLAQLQERLIVGKSEINHSITHQATNQHLHQQQVNVSAAVATNDDSQPQICMICEDKATGLHYGIITCEGCKGFFKRTVQNKRVYTCISENNCIITKQQRNRCQSCRFQKCLRQGMVLAAVREDRMPGGRNSGAVYNMYKVKYKKHKNKNQQIRASSSPQSTDSFSVPPSTGSPTVTEPIASQQCRNSTTSFNQEEPKRYLQQIQSVAQETAPLTLGSSALSLSNSSLSSALSTTSTSITSHSPTLSSSLSSTTNSPISLALSSTAATCNRTILKSALTSPLLDFIQQQKDFK